MICFHRGPPAWLFVLLLLWLNVLRTAAQAGDADDPTGTPPKTASGMNTSSSGTVDDSRPVEEARQLDSELYRLERTLLTNYLPHHRPVRSFRTATNISLVLKVIAVHEVSENYQTLRYLSWLNLDWRDEFLTWDPQLYDGLRNIELPESKIWTPNLYFSNSASGSGFVKDMTAVNGRVNWDGSVAWCPVGMQESLCSTMDITYYPFDSQRCDAVISLWTSGDTEINLTHASATKDEFFQENSEWRLEGLSVSFQSTRFQGEAYTYIFFSFQLERRRLFYTLTLIVPNVLLALLTALVFALPEPCGEKVSFSMSLLLAFAVNLSVLVNTMPQSSLHASLLMIYLTCLSVVTALSVVTTVWLLKLYHKVEVVGPKVTAVILRLRHVFRLRKVRGVTIIRTADGEEHVLQRHSCGLDNSGLTRVVDERPYVHNDVFYTLSSRITLTSLHTDPRDANKNEKPAPMGEFSDLGEGLGGGEHGGVGGSGGSAATRLLWKDVAQTLDYVFFRLFVFIIVGTTFGFLVALFVGMKK